MPNGSDPAGHHVEVGQREHPRDVSSSQEAGEEHTVSDAELGGHANHAFRLVTTSSHDKLDVAGVFEHFFGGRHEELRPLLIRDATEVQHNPVVPPDLGWCGAVFRKFHAVVDHPATIGRCSVSRHDQVPGQRADTDHTVRFSDASRFNREDVWVAMFARTIEFGAVDVDDQGFAGQGAER